MIAIVRKSTDGGKGQTRDWSQSLFMARFGLDPHERESRTTNVNEALTHDMRILGHSTRPVRDSTAVREP